MKARRRALTMTSAPDPISPAGDDYLVQLTREAGGAWVEHSSYRDAAGAKQMANFLIGTGQAASVRVLQVRLYGWSEGDGFESRDDIG